MAKTYAKHDPIKVISMHCSAINLPRHLKEQFVSDVRRWYRANGAQYVVERLKFVKQCCVRYYASDGADLPPKLNDVWFKRNKDGLLYGHWSRLMKLMLVQPQDVMKLVMSYTVFATGKKPTEKQISKFVSAIEEPFSGDSSVLNEVSFYLYRDSKAIISAYMPDEAKHLIKSDIKRPKAYINNARFNNESHKTNIHKDALDRLYQPNVLNAIVRLPWVDDVFNHTFGDPNNEDFGVINWTPTIMGEVNWINEPGLKERIVTDFYKPFEHLTFELGKRLYDIVYHLPWDTTFHEDKGYRIIQQALKEGKTCHCYDLSKATDRFPVVWQEFALKSLDLGVNYREQLSLLSMFIKQHAKLPNGQLTKWTVGQPMGAFPSFAMFTLTHGLILMLYLHSKGIKYDGQFVVHGDDIVIMDDELADWYYVLMSYSGTPFNDFKAVISSKCAEFNSRLITADGFIFMRKYRPVTLDSVMDQVQYWGPKCINWLPNSRYKRNIVKKILSIPFALPNGGSINPHGLSAVQRVMNIPSSVLDIIYNSDSKAKEFCSSRSIATTHLRGNSRFAFGENQGLHFDESMMVYGDAILQQHLGFLEYSDNLDKGILEDSSNFIKFFNMCQSKNDIYALATCAEEEYSLSDLSIAQTQFDVLGHMVKHFDELIGACYNYNVSIRNIRTYNTRKTTYSSLNNSKLFKCLKAFEREKKRYA